MILKILPLVRLMAPQDKWRNDAKETGHVEEVPNKRNQLRADQPNVTGANNKEIRPSANGECGPEIEKEKQWNKHPTVQQLVGLDRDVNGPTAIVMRCGHRAPDQSALIDQQ